MKAISECEFECFDLTMLFIDNSFGRIMSFLKSVNVFFHKDEN